MSEINLSMSISTGATIISNAFIERFINVASASHIRFYLYLMYYSQNHKSFSISSACDFLDDSEKDIMRSICYWENQGVFSITRTDDDTITSISISDACPAPEAKDYEEASDIFADDCEEKECELDLGQVIQKASELAGRTLSSSEIDFICDLNEKLNFSTELIIYLYEYCCLDRSVSRFNYIQTVALSWAEKNITTVKDAKAESDIFSCENASVMKSFGLSRLPGLSEKQYIEKWFHIYNMSSEMVTEACGRTLMQLAKPDFKYADSILKSWFSNGFSNLEEVKAADKAHYMAKQNLKVVNGAAAKPVNNRFTNFEQRNYSDADMENITQKWLKKA